MARLLSIEDDADIQHMIGQVLFREGYEITYAWNGREGYEKILSFHPDLILLDLMLPIMNGVEFLEKVQNDKLIAGIPIVVISGYGDEVNLLGHSVRALGAADYLRKPVNANELVSCVAKHLASGRRSIAPEKELRKGVVRADPRLRTVWINDRLVATLSQKRFDLLKCLMEAAGSISREDILLKMGYAAHQGDALKQDVHRLRRDFGAEERRIQTTSDGYELLG